MSPANKHSATAVIVIDHGSRSEESNKMFLDLVVMVEQTSTIDIVEPAHMELAEPSLATAFQRCVRRGADLIVIHPYFLLPGKHWEQDIPRLAAAAAREHAGVRYLVTAPLGLHRLMPQIINDRVRQCMDHAAGDAGPCPLCESTERCAIRSAPNPRESD